MRGSQGHDRSCPIASNDPKSGLEKVVAEILFEGAPYAGDMRATVARVVVLQQKGRALDVVIVRSSQFQAPRPAKANLVETGLLESAEVLDGKAFVQHAQIRVDDF